MQSPSSPESAHLAVTDAPGFLAQSREYLLGRATSRWLDKTGERAFSLVETHMEQAEAGQAVINNLIENYRLGIMPVRQELSASGDVVDVEMSPLAFGKQLMDLIETSGANVDRAVTTRNKVSSGGVNFAAAAIMMSEQARLQAMRRERTVNNPSRRLGVDALRSVPDVIEV